MAEKAKNNGGTQTAALTDQAHSFYSLMHSAHPMNDTVVLLWRSRE